MNGFTPPKKIEDGPSVGNPVQEVQGEGSLTPQEYSSGRDGVLTNGISLRNGDEFDGVVINSLMPEEKSGGYKNLGEFINKLQQKNPEYYEKFMEAFFDSYNISDPDLRRKILEDKDLREQFLVVIKEGFQMKKSPKSYSLFRKSLIGKFSGVGTNLSPEKSMVETEKFDKIYSNQIFVQRMIYLRDKILATGNEKAIQLWYDGITLLRKDYRDKKITTLNDFLDRLDQTYAVSIKETGDKELDEMWQAYKENEPREGVDFSFSQDSSKPTQPEKSDDKPASKQEIDKAIDGVQEAGGYKIDRDDNGGVKFFLDNDITVYVSVFVDRKDGGYVFYLNDKFSNQGSLRVKAEDLPLALYERHLDGRITTRFSEKYPKFFEIVSEMPDQKITHLCETILGDRKDRGYKVVDDDLKVLNTLVDLLMRDDEKYPSLLKKIEALNFYINTESRGQYAYKQLLAGKFSSVSDVIKEFDVA